VKCSILETESKSAVALPLLWRLVKEADPEICAESRQALKPLNK